MFCIFARRNNQTPSIMNTSKHTLPGATIEVTPTMQALGDQPYRCRVYPDQLNSTQRTPPTFRASSLRLAAARMRPAQQPASSMRSIRTRSKSKCKILHFNPEITA